MLTCCLLLARAAAAQTSPTIQFPRRGAPISPSTVPSTTVPPNSGMTSPYLSGGSAAPSGGFSAAPTAQPFGGFSAPASTFDPYSNSPIPSSSFWNQPAGGGAFGGNMSGGGNVVAPNSTSPWRNPFPGQQTNSTIGSLFGQPPPNTTTASPWGNYGTVNGPQNGFGTQPPNSVFPNGFWNNSNNLFDYNATVRLIQDLRLQHTHVFGNDDPTDVQADDTEVSVTFAWPNFFGSGQPLFITPAFAIHLWDGPKNLPADLPGSAYSAYLDFQHQTDPTQQLGAELGVRVGVYSDFDTYIKQSLRVTGLGLGTIQLTPNAKLKLGVMYIGRNRIKLLPAGGVTWTPNPQTQLDIFFPRPKFSQYLTTANNGELWWYLMGEYGGGAWTIERADGTKDRVDLNDIRVGIGLDFVGSTLFSGFAEGGYIFNREAFYVVDPTDRFDIGDGFYVRAGISY